MNLRYLLLITDRRHSSHVPWGMAMIPQHITVPFGMGLGSDVFDHVGSLRVASDGLGRMLT
jgi:hypothetical protein